MDQECPWSELSLSTGCFVQTAGAAFASCVSSFGIDVPTGMLKQPARPKNRSPLYSGNL